MGTEWKGTLTGLVVSDDQASRSRRKSLVMRVEWMRFRSRERAEMSVVVGEPWPLIDVAKPTARREAKRAARARLSSVAEKWQSPTPLTHGCGQ